MLSLRRAARVTFSIDQSGMISNPAILKSKIPRVLIVGGSGRLGRLLRRAIGAGDLAARSGVDLIWQGRMAGAGADLVFDPLGAASAYARAAGAVDVIFNLAGVTAGSEADLALNADLALAALAAVESTAEATGAASGRLPVLLASSAAVYGAATGRLDEAALAVPTAPYGHAKLAMEAASLARAQAHGTPLCCLRIGNVAGADALLGQPAPQGGRVLDTFADGRAPRRSYIGPTALARAVLTLARRAAEGEALPDRLNLALPGAVGMDDLLRARGEGWTRRPAPASAIAEVCLEVCCAVALGLVPAEPANAAAIVADLDAALREGTS